MLTKLDVNEQEERLNRLRKKYVTGEIVISNSGHPMQVIDVEDRNLVTVMFDYDPKKVRCGIMLSEFKQGKVKSYDDSADGRLGTRRLANCGIWMTIIAYRGTNDIDVIFDTGEIVHHRTWANFIKGKIAVKARQYA